MGFIGQDLLGKSKRKTTEVVKRANWLKKPGTTIQSRRINLLNGGEGVGG